MSSEAVISVRGLGKSYTIAHNGARATTAGEAIMQRLRSPLARPQTETFWALKDVSFDIERGDVVGIIGRNGAGKSTLLKILSRITKPTTGEARLRGRVGSLLEVGTGFSGELTGRENVYLNGAILGMTRKEIARQFDAIVQFSGVEQFLDTPVKRYSSGMYVRLAFAVAAHLEPEILIVDEVLAVGDAEFQKKCLGKMQDVARHGRTIIFVSHNMGSVRMLCNKCILLQQGHLEQYSQTEQIIDRYLTEHATLSGAWNRTAPTPTASGIYFDRIELLNNYGVISGNVDSHKPFDLRLTLTATADLNNAQVAVRVTNQEGIPIFTTANTDKENAPAFIPRGQHVYTVPMPYELLPPGSYSILVASMMPGSKMFDVVDGEFAFIIEDLHSSTARHRDGRLGVVNPAIAWVAEEAQVRIPVLR